MGYFFIKERDIDGDTVTIKGKEFRHIREVLRAKKNDRLILITGNGTEYHTVITRAGMSSLSVRIVKTTRKSNEAGIFISIGIAPPKGKRMEWFVEKATELGVSEIIPVITNRSVVSPGEARVERWRRVAIAAVKQAERSVLPTIQQVQSYEEFLLASMVYPLRFIAYEKQREGIIEEAVEKKKPSKILALVGPEGGFEEWEVSEAKEQGFIPVTLGPTKLRTETAGIVVLTRILAAA
jgi:16S rRNA (uracil1498-N3)-methyltransferase